MRKKRKHDWAKGKNEKQKKQKKTWIAMQYKIKFQLTQEGHCWKPDDPLGMCFVGQETRSLYFYNDQSQTEISWVEISSEALSPPLNSCDGRIEFVWLFEWSPHFLPGCPQLLKPAVSSCHIYPSTDPLTTCQVTSSRQAFFKFSPVCDQIVL